MNPVGKTAASSGAGAAVVGVIIWALSYKNITVPADVAADLVLIVATVAHWVAEFLMQEKAPVVVPAAPAAPAQQ